MENTLHLNLKRKWFDMILSGVKTEEYRDIKPFYDKRFKHLFPQNISGETYYPVVDKITFSNGYAKDRPQFVIEIKELLKGRRGYAPWGAEANKEYYLFKLGKVVQVGRQGFHFKVTDEMSVDEIVSALKI